MNNRGFKLPPDKWTLPIPHATDKHIWRLYIWYIEDVDEALRAWNLFLEHINEIKCKIEVNKINYKV
jgi:hypothetical protein